MRYLLATLVALILCSCNSTSRFDAPQDLTQEVPPILSEHYSGARFYSPVPEISGQAWKDFAREAIAGGKPAEELPGLLEELQETIRDRVYQAATGASFLKVPYDLDEYESEHEFLVVCSVKGLNVVSASSLGTQGVDLGSIFGKRKDDVRSRAVVADIEMNLVQKGERCGASSAQGFGPVTTGALTAGDAADPIEQTPAVSGDGPSADSATDLDADAAGVIEPTISITSAANKAITDAVSRGWPSLWATLAERLEAKAKLAEASK